jgi:Heterokaryon incompatibility protein (HET)
MGDIYRNTKQGLIWLGDLQSLGVEETDNSLTEMIEMLNSNKHTSELPCFQDTGQLIYANAFRTLGLLLKSPWWQRIWTVQEAVLPPAATLIWGNMSVSWESFQTAAMFLIQHGTECCLDLSQNLSFECQSVIDRFTTQVSAIYLIRRCPNSDPMECLWRFRLREATDPRDKVFGLLGLLPNLSLGGKAKDYYSIDVVELFHLLTLALIRFDNSLKCMIGRRGESSNDPNIASWAAEWLLPPSQRPGLGYKAPRARYWSHIARWRFFHADRGFKVMLQEGPGAGVLSLDGLHVDRIIAVGEPFISLDGQVDSALQLQRIRQWRELGNVYTSPGGAYIAGGTWKDAFWRSMVGNLMLHKFFYQVTREAIPEDEQAFKYYECSIKHSSKMERSIQNMIVNQTFFITEQGYIGIAPLTLHVGDEVWVLFGSRLPFALRPLYTTPGGQNATLHYIFIGDCYVHGIMQGEAMDRYQEKRRTVRLY